MCNLTTIGVLPITANKQKLWGESSVERERNLLFKGYAVGNNGRILPQSPFPLRHPKKITLLFSAGSVQGCARSYFSHSKVHPLRNCSLISWFQSLSGFRHLSESVPTPYTQHWPLLPSAALRCVCIPGWAGPPIAQLCGGGASVQGKGVGLAAWTHDPGFLLFCPTGPVPAVFLVRQAHTAVWKGHPQEFPDHVVNRVCQPKRSSPIHPTPSRPHSGKEGKTKRWRFHALCFI